MNKHSITLSFLLFSLSISLSAQHISPEKLAYLDSLIQVKMEENQIVGTAYLIVKGDSIYEPQTFGYANKKEGTSLVANHQHMFGSLSKLFTATLLMDLVEEHVLDLTSDIRTFVPYLDIQYPTTLHHLLTHTAGFEEQVLDRTRRLNQQKESLKQYLTRKLPAQIEKPGVVTAYSNHGIALAGLVAEEAMGIPYEELMKDRVFKTLNMQTARFQLDDSFIDQMATPYMNGRSSELQYVQTVPASMMVGSIYDLGSFIHAQLNHSPEKLSSGMKRMQSTQFRHNEMLYGRGYGFFERHYRGKRGLQHGNTRNGYFSLLYIIPEDTLGMVVTATGSQTSFRNDIVYGFLDQIYPEWEADSTPWVSNKELDMAKLSGKYHSLRTNETGLEKVFHKLRPDIVEVKAVDNTILAYGETYYPIGNNSFQEEGGTHRLAFKTIDGATFLLLPGRADTYKKVSGLNNPTWHIYLLMILVLVLLVLTISEAVNLIRKVKNPRNPWVFFTHLSISVFLITFLASGVVIGNNLQYGLPGFFAPLFYLPYVFIFLIGIQTYLHFTQKRLVRKFGLLSALYILMAFEIYYWGWL